MFRKLAVILSLTMLLQGCAITPAEIQSDGTAVASALNGIALVIVSTDPQDAAALQLAAQSITVATQNWTSNSPVAILNSAASAAEAVLTRIGQNNVEVALVADLLPIAVAAIDVLVAAASNQPVPANAKKVIPHKLGRSPKGDLQAAWEAKAQNHPQLVKSILR